MLPILCIVILLGHTIVPIPTDLMLCFLIGAVMICVGMGLFTFGAETSMTPIGSRIGSALTQTKKLPLIMLVSFLLGFAVTVAEPDLQVLAETVPHIDNLTLLITVGCGVGFFLMICMVRMIIGLKLRWLLIAFYGLVFLLAFFTDKNLLSVAFDSGGVTTGPMTVPFILAFGVGLSNIRSDKNAEADSFGLVALCSIGPILAVLLLGLFSGNQDAVVEISAVSCRDTVEIGRMYLREIPTYLWEMAVSMAPIVVIFLVFQWLSLRLSGKNLLKICFGILSTYIGLVLFLTGVNVGFSSLGAVLGASLAQGWTRYLMIPLAMLLGWFIISAEPAVYVLEKQIEDVSAGAIPGKAIKYSLSVAIALAMGLSMLRVLTGISIMWFLIPGYTLAILLSFRVPDIYTAIAFDSGGVASGPMTATFMLQFMMGVSIALGGNVLTDAFGIVALVAMMPLLSIQMVGFYYQLRAKKVTQELENYGDCDIIELWEEPA